MSIKETFMTLIIDMMAVTSADVYAGGNTAIDKLQNVNDIVNILASDLLPTGMCNIIEDWVNNIITQDLDDNAYHIEAIELIVDRGDVTIDELQSLLDILSYIMKVLGV